MLVRVCLDVLGIQNAAVFHYDTLLDETQIFLNAPHHTG